MNRIGGVAWVDLSQDRKKWRASLNPLMNFVFHKMRRNFVTG